VYDTHDTHEKCMQNFNVKRGEAFMKSKLGGNMILKSLAQRNNALNGN